MKIAFSHRSASPDGPIRVANGRPIRRRLEPVMRDLNEFTITAEVLRRIENTPDPRLHEILASAIRHLHDFARETTLTEAEWMEGIKFLTRTGHMCSDVRQEFVLLSAPPGLYLLVVAQNPHPPSAAPDK